MTVPLALVPERASRVLVVEDDETVADVVVRYMQHAGHEVLRAATGADGLECASRWRPDLVVLDLMLPDLGGLEVCRRLREGRDVAVVMLTSLGEESDRIAGLEVGADDYVTKPFSPRELVLRVQSVLRRTTPAPEPLVVDSGVIRIDVAAREAYRRGELLNLTTREFDLLAFLVRNPRVAFDRTELLERVWGWTYGDQATVTVHVRRLREKIEDDPTRPAMLATVWGVGYRWEHAG